MGATRRLCYVIGNEIPAPVVRWYGRRRIERILERLYAQKEDPEGLVTYVFILLPNTCSYLSSTLFPSTSTSRSRSLEDYLARLHNVAGRARPWY